MLPIKLAENEQILLKARKKAVDESRAAIALQAAAETIASLHGANASGWTFSPDFSTLNPPGISNLAIEEDKP